MAGRDRGGRDAAELAADIRYVEACRARNSAVVALLLMAPLLHHGNTARPTGRADLTVACVLAALVVGNLGRLGLKYLLMTRDGDTWVPHGRTGAAANGIAVLGAAAGFAALLVQIPGTGERTAITVLSPMAALAIATGTACWVLARDRRWSPWTAVEPVPQPSGFQRSAVDREGDARPFAGMVIACSGGGIRSAAFCLGALQRLRRPIGGQPSLYDRASRVYAVSGGNYAATALHLARRESPQEAHGDLFQPGSPEEDWLRRRSKFLIASGGDLLRGTLSLVYGLAINLLLLGIAGFVLAWYLGWSHHRLPTLCGPAGGAPDAGCLLRGDEVTLGAQWGQAWWLPVVLAGPILFVLAKVLAKYGHGRLRLRVPTQVLVVGGLTLGAVGALPAALAGLHDAAVAGKPTAVVARAMAAVDLVSPRACRDAALAELREGTAPAWGQAPVTGAGAPLAVTYAACGETWTDDVRLVAPAGEVPAGGPDVRCADPATAGTPAFCTDFGGGTFSPLERAGTVTAAVLALAGAVRTFTGGLPTSSGALRRVVDVARRVVVPWLAVSVLGLVAVLILLLLVRDNLVDPGRIAGPGALLAAIGAFGVIRVVTDATLTSMHPFYRERLSDTFLVKRHDGMARPLGYRTLTPVDSAEPKGPGLVVCCAANLSDRDYVPADRACASFRFETGRRAERTARIGISDDRLPAGHLQPAGSYSTAAEPEGLDTTLAAAMAVSGAAFSPLVGRMNARVRPYRVLLALGNARLGVWLPNPYLVDEAERWRQARARKRAAADGAPARPLVPRAVWRFWRRAWRPGPFRVLKEAFGRPSLFDGRLYVTDGGHYDNTGIVEALRDRPAVLFAIDASADPADSLDALSQAIVTARMDLGLIIRPAPDSPATGIRGRSDQRPPENGWLHLTVATVAEPERTVSHIWFVKNVLTDAPNLELENYRRLHPEFPITSTGDQSYGEYDFEAYRLLGYLNTDAMLARESSPEAAPAPGPVGVTRQTGPKVSVPV